MIRVLIAALVPLTLVGILEFTLVKVIRTLPEWCLWVYVILAILGYIGGLIALTRRQKRAIDRSSFSNFLVGWSLIAFTQKIVLFLLIAVMVIASLMISDDARLSLMYFGYISTLALMLLMIYGITIGKYRYVTEESEVTFDDLPMELDGLRIVHISDIHAGTWDRLSGVQKGINQINALEADLILFTGDLVNTNKDEIDPFITLFKTLKAKYGKYAILGNHDYYGQPRDRALRSAYYEDLYGKFDQMGFDLILNDSRQLKFGDSQLSLVGVENWGSGRYFPKRGDIDLSLSEVSDDDFAILLSHDPSHWDLIVRKHPRAIPLTLSGHTHGMQFGINLPFFKWSPVQYRYKYWMGLYQDSGRQLYVNRGFGLLGYPGRVGMSPEITLLTLKRK